MPVRIVMLLLILSHPAAAAVLGWRDVTVRVYDSAHVPAAVREKALSTAGTTLSAASVEATWRRCPPRAATTAHACAQPMARGDLVVRIIRGPVSAARQGWLPLGDAMVDPDGESGVLATIYFDRVQWLASQAGVDVATLLGRAIAHEIGHLLLATTTHSDEGLMRAVWSGMEIRRDRPADWRFTAQDVARLHTRENIVWGTH